MNNKFWMLVHPHKGIWFLPPAISAKEAWENAEMWEQYLSGGASIVGWRDVQFLLGWRAKPVKLVEE